MRLKINSKLIHWITTLAILMSALAPAISQAVALNDISRSLESEICSVAGVKLIHVGAINDQSNDHQSSTEHCPYCVLQANFLPLFNTNLNFSLGQDQDLFPHIYYQSPKPLPSWLILPSRAPPQIS